MTAPTDVPATLRPQRRSRLRLSLRMLVAVVLACGVGLGWKADKVRRARRGISAVRAMGGRVAFDYEQDATGAPQGRSPSTPRWLVRWLGVEFFHDVHGVYFDGSNDVPDEGRSRIAALGFLKDLNEVRHLHIWRRDMGDDIAATMPPLRRLKSLHFDASRVGDRGLAWIAACRNLEKLEVFAPATSDATARLAAGLPRLKELAFCSQGLTDAGVEAIAACRGLEVLYLYGPDLGDRSLAAVGTLTGLKRLTLWRLARATGRGFDALASLKGLEEAELRGPSIHEWDVASLRGLPALKNLTLREGALGPRAFSASDGFAGLDRLALVEMGIDDGAIANLTRVKSLRTLVMLSASASREALGQLSLARPNLTVRRIGASPRPPAASSPTPRPDP